MGRRIPRDHHQIRSLHDEGRSAREIAEGLTLPLHAVEYSLRVTRPAADTAAATEAPRATEDLAVSAEVLAEVRAAINGGPLPADMSIREYAAVAPKVAAADRAAVDLANRRRELVSREAALAALSDIYYRCLEALGSALVKDLVRSGAAEGAAQHLLDAAAEKVRQVVSGHDELLRSGSTGE